MTVKAEAKSDTEYPGRYCRPCFMDYRKEWKAQTPKEMSEHVDKVHKHELGSFLVRR